MIQGLAQAVDSFLPTGSLDSATLFWRLGEFNSMVVARHASWPEGQRTGSVTFSLFALMSPKSLFDFERKVCFWTDLKPHCAMQADTIPWSWLGNQMIHCYIHRNIPAKTRTDSNSYPQHFLLRVFPESQCQFWSNFQSYNSGSGNHCLAYLHNYLSLIKQPDVFLPRTDIRQKPYWNPGIVMVWIMATRLMSEDVCSRVQSSFNIKWRFTIPPTLPSIKSSANKKMNIKSPLEEGT